MWISVKDRLPEEKQIVLKWYKFPQLPYDTNICVGKIKSFDTNVLFWASLPAPPTNT